jgi:APA family basic amino acid/polyamine antiporter
MAGLPVQTWVRLFVWLAIGLVIYFAYGRRKAERVRADRVAAAAKGPDLAA